MEISFNLVAKTVDTCVYTVLPKVSLKRAFNAEEKTLAESVSITFM